MQSLQKRLFQLISGAPPKPIEGKPRISPLQTVRNSLDVLGLSDIENKLPVVIHVAGTKGKGSTCTMCEAICLKAGLRTGLFTSPHLVKVNERFRIGGKPIGDELLLKNFNHVWKVLDEANKLPAYYSFLTVLAFQIFASEQLDVVILEVGMGGRLDATNVLSKKTVTGVTLLDYDHMEYLGDTIELIAAEKAGIFLKDVPAFVLPQQPGAMSVLKEKAGEVGAPLQEVTPLQQGQYKLGMQGDHQRFNAALAVALCQSALGDRINDSIIRQGLETCSMAGRAQIVQKQSIRYCFDGAHTPQSMKACIKWFESLDAKNCCLIFNCQHTKATKELLETIALSTTRFHTVVFTHGGSKKPSFVKRPTSQQILEEAVGDSAAVIEETWQETLAKVWKGVSAHPSTVVFDKSLSESISYLQSVSEAKGEDLTVLVTGSLLLIGDVMKELEIEPN